MVEAELDSKHAPVCPSGVYFIIIIILSYLGYLSLALDLSVMSMLYQIL